MVCFDIILALDRNDGRQIPRHEHLYTELESKLIISDKLSSKEADVQRLLGGSRIILSTLGMLSNPVLHLVGIFSAVPVKRLVIDEASQIKMEDFMVRIPCHLIQPILPFSSISL